MGQRKIRCPKCEATLLFTVDLKAPKETEAKQRWTQEVEVVTEAYERAFPGGRITQAGRRCVRGRLSDGYTVEDLVRAIRGCLASDWHRNLGKTQLSHILSSGKRTDMFIGKLENSQAPKATAKTRRAVDLVRRVEG